MTRLFLVFFLVFGFSLSSQGYIPRIDTIVKKMVRNNGRTPYKVVREITFEAGDNRLRARETWYIKNGEDMKLVVESTNPDDPWKFEIIYEKGKRQTVSSTGNVKKFERSEEFFESLFHDRFHKSLMKRMVGFKVLPDWAPKIEEPTYKDGKTKMTEEPFVRLEPTEGAVTYAIGAQQNADGER